MKKEYKAPVLTAHGSIESITKAIGNAPVADTLSVGGQVVPNTDGSSDFVFP